MSLRGQEGVPTLAHLNLLSAAFESVSKEDSSGDVAVFIEQVAYLFDELSPDQILRDINEDRAIAGFPEVRSLDEIESELTERKRHYRNTMKEALNKLPPMSLVSAMTSVVEEVTGCGEFHAPELIDDLVDSYEVETQGILDKEAQNVEKLIEAARSAAPKGEHAVKPVVEKLINVATNWDNIAQPIQVSAMSRGIDHDPSHELAYSIRSLAVDLFNEHDMLEQSRRLTELSQALFAELPELVDRLEQDADALADIFENRQQAEEQEEEWARSITYSAEVGVVFKDKLSISPDGVAWKNKRFPLDAITRVRWGAVRNSVNGISTGTDYTIAFGDNRSEAIVELKKESIYSKFLEKLWNAVVIRLLTELFETLQAGNDVCFGEAVLSDDGITLIKHKFLGANEKVRCSWGQVHVWSEDGSFYVGSKGDKKIYVGLSYIHVPNTHVLEQAIRMAFKKPGMRRLSDMLH